ncbi:MAG TPA: BON domain-containing protein [Candidatus Limnocylindria bacterium]|jgi:osmotically-inducible protein OsmY|nr:BON domain-containing protein [Candidatus Limnocylindria bacterium]
MKTTLFKSDSQLRQDVIDEIERDWRFKAAELGVEVDQGIVTLTGTVSSYSKLVAAADIAAEIAGTKGVANELTVHARDMAHPNDTELASAVRNALKWDVDVPDEKIEVIVRDGVVTLKGAVDYWYEKSSAAASVRNIAGVSAINNHIAVLPPKVSDHDIGTAIDKAIARRIPLAARNIKVQVEHGHVTLTGNVQFYGDRLQAERSAWTTEGVRGVDNKIIATW